MAYSDYGGHVYRNGELVLSRCDWTLTEEGGVGTPGCYPGFAAILAGCTSEEVRSFAERPHFHAALGDSPLILGLYKQSTFSIYRGVDRLKVTDLLDEASRVDGCVTIYDGQPYFETDVYLDAEKPAVFLVDGARVEMHWTHEDNYYQYARLEQADGTIWHGWSGYGVGAGFEDSQYGYSGTDRDAMLGQLWPDFKKMATARSAAI